MEISVNNIESIQKVDATEFNVHEINKLKSSEGVRRSESKPVSFALQ